MISIVNTECHVPKTFSDLAKIAAWGRLGLIAGVLVLWLGTNWPELLVGFATAIIAIQGGVEILRDARAETKKSERRRSEARRVGKECVSKCRTWWAPDN